MNIVLISNLFPPFVRGGAEMVAAQTAKALKERGHTVTVISTCPKKSGTKGYEVERGEWEGIPVLRFFPQEVYFSLDDHKHAWFTRLLWHIQDAFNVYSAGVVRKILKGIKPDVVMTHNLKGIGLFIPGILRELNIPHIHTLHDVQLIEPSGLIMQTSRLSRWLTFLPYSAYRTCTRLLLGSPNGVISPTEWLLQLHADHYFFPKARTVIIQNPVRDTEGEHQYPPASNQASATLLNAYTRPRFVFVGQIEAHKGIRELLQSWTEVEKDHHVDATLDIVGEGTLLAKLRAQIGVHERITFHGRLPNEKVLRLLSGATALVFPSTCMENAPGAILESLSVGTPVIASDIGGIPEFVKPGQTGWLVESGSIEQIARAIRHAATHPKEIAMLRQNIKNKPKMTLKKYVELLENECQRLLTK